MNIYDMTPDQDERQSRAGLRRRILILSAGIGTSTLLALLIYAVWQRSSEKQVLVHTPATVANSKHPVDIEQKLVHSVKLQAGDTTDIRDFDLTIKLTKFEFVSSESKYSVSFLVESPGYQTAQLRDADVGAALIFYGKSRYRIAVASAASSSVTLEVTRAPKQGEKI